MYLSLELAHKRVTALETFWNESLWVKIKVSRDIYLIGLFYSPRTADTLFFDPLNKVNRLSSESLLYKTCNYSF